MSISVKVSGTWTNVKSVYVKQAGVWVPVQKVLEKNAGTWTQVYAAEVVATISANTNNIVVRNLFSSADWADNKRKRVEILPGVIVGSTSAGVPALATGAGAGGQIVINNAGSIHGAGGAANSGAGGNAVFVQQANVTINNSSAIRGGGGGGGRGGNGGAGYYNYIVTEGPLYNEGSPRSFWSTTNGTSINAGWWQGTNLGPNNTQTQVTIGDFTYYRYGDILGHDGTTSLRAIIRQYTATQGTSGGAGGNGGRGQGSDGNLTAGSGGAAGDTNAGTGGTGGSGGNWGVVGNTGNTGGSGNNGGGSAGSVGGAAGAAIIGTARTLNNTGTINGST